MNYINGAERGVLKAFPEDYGKDGKYPTESDFIDFTLVDEDGPEVYTFESKNDMVCYTSAAKQVTDAMPTFQARYEYGCDTDHIWFSQRGMAQDKWIQDMITVLGANTLALGVASMAAASYALF